MLSIFNIKIGYITGGIKMKKLIYDNMITRIYPNKIRILPAQRSSWEMNAKTYGIVQV